MQNIQSQALDRQYLLKQNRKLRMQLKQSNTIKQLHQQALMEMNQKYSDSKIISTLICLVNKQSNQCKIHNLNEMIMQLQAKVMVLEKISTQTEQSQKQTYNLLADQFQKLKAQNTKKDQQLHKFYEKIGEVDYLSGLVTKYKQIVSTSQQSMAFKKQQESLLDALNMQQYNIKKLTQEKQKLLKINIHMKQEVEKRKDECRNMTIMFMNDQYQNQQSDNTQNILADLHFEGENTGRNQLLVPQPSRRSIESISTNISKINMSRLNNSMINNQQNTTINFIKMQRELLKEVNEQDEMNSSYQSQLDCPELSILFPDKVQKIIKTKEQIKVPYLNMKKVREMMAKRQQKMRKQWQQQKNHINPTTKIIQLQTQLDITRKQLASQSLKFRLMMDQIKNLRLRIEQIDSRNQCLVESNNKLRTNYQTIAIDHQLLKSITTQLERLLGININEQNQQQIKRKLRSFFITQKLNQQRNNWNTPNTPDILNNLSTINTMSKIHDQNKHQGLMLDVFRFKDVFKKRHNRYYSH